MSNGFDPDQDRRSVGPDLDQNCLQRSSSADDESKESFVYVSEVVQDPVAGSIDVFGLGIDLHAVYSRSGGWLDRCVWTAY